MKNLLYRRGVVSGLHARYKNCDFDTENRERPGQSEKFENDIIMYVYYIDSPKGCNFF